MGNSPSTPLQACISNVFASNPAAVSFPGNLLYQTYVQPYNLAIPVTPAAVVKPTTAEEISEVLKCANRYSVKVQAKSGGHSYGNYGLGGQNGEISINMANFQKFEMDRDTWQATIGAGTLLGDVTSRLHDAGGRAIAHGTCPQVGIGGHATIGGLGPVSRLWGSSLDHVLEVEVVLANGTITRASSSQNQDIFFAIKGAASSFGIVTEFVFKTHPEPTQTVQYSYSISVGSHTSMASTFATWQRLVSNRSLTRKLAMEVVITPLTMIIAGTFFGTKEEYDVLGFEEQLTNGSEAAVTVGLNDWLGSVANWAEGELVTALGSVSVPFYSKSLALTPSTLIPQEGIEQLFHYLDVADAGTPTWFIIFDLQGGATNDVPQDTTAYVHRDALFYLQSYAIGLTGVTPTIQSFLDNINLIVQDSIGAEKLGAYPGYVDPRLPNGQEAYWGSNLPRLQRIKSMVDPGDVFHNPQSVMAAI